MVIVGYHVSMTQEMASGTEFGQRLFHFTPRNWGMFSRVDIADYIQGPPVPSSLLNLYQHVGRFFCPNSQQFNFFIVYKKTFPGNGSVSIPLVCTELWQTMLDISSEQQRIDLYVCPSVFLADQDVSKGTKVSISLFELIPPLPGVTKTSLSHDKISQVCQSIVVGRCSLSMDLKAKLWKNILGVFPPSLTTQGDRKRYFSSLCAAAREMKQAWLAKYNDSHAETVVLYNSIKRDARRTDPGLDFFAPQGEVSPNGEDSVSCLANVVMTYVEEHKHQAYTQGMTDLVAPILYVVTVAKQQSGVSLSYIEHEVYVMYSAMMTQISNNFTPNCQGAMEKVECLRHLCQVFDIQLYQKLTSFEDDAFSLCFGTLLIDCRREFPFAAGIQLMEVIWSSRFIPEAPDKSAVEWASFMTTESKNLLHHAIRGEVPLSVGRSSSVSTNDVLGPDERCYQERPAIGYAVTPLPSNNEGVVQSLLESGRVTPYRPFDPEQNVSTASVDLENTEQEEDPLESSVHSHYEPVDLDQVLAVSVKTSFSVFVCMSILISLREQILREDTDFVELSLILKRSRDRQDLDVNRVLSLARDLRHQYSQYQKLLSLPSTSWIHTYQLERPQM